MTGDTLTLRVAPARVGDSVLTAWRGQTQVWRQAYPNYSASELADETLAMARELRRPSETPVAYVEGGGIGAAVYDQLRARAEQLEVRVAEEPDFAPDGSVRL